MAVPLKVLTLITFLILSVTNIKAETFEVSVSGISFEPEIMTIQPGDTIKWKGMQGHSTSMIEELSPSEVMAWDSPIGQDYQNTFNETGIYIYKCKPHSSLGMAGAVIVGTPNNLDDLREASLNHDHKELVNQAIERAENQLSDDWPW